MYVPYSSYNGKFWMASSVTVSEGQQQVTVLKEKQSRPIARSEMSSATDGF